MNLHISPSHLPYLQITLSIPSFSPGEPIHLARWRPGRYEAANYTKFIRNVTCTTNSGANVPLIKDNFYTWRPQLTETTDLTLSYEYFANQLDAGSTYADTDICYLNFLNFFLFTPSRLEESIKINIDLPEDFTTGTALANTGTNQWEASDFYELADSPLLSSANLYSASYTIEKIPFTLWFHNIDPNEVPYVIRDFEKFTRHQVQELDGFPVSEYHFLIITYPTPLYHGVEHGKSTVICLGPSDQVFQDRYDDLLGISSHELFHAWNIIHVRPREFVPYNFTEIVSIDTGFVAEGFTTYLGDLFLMQSGVKNTDWYLKELSILLRRHVENFGRLESSLVESSRDLWADGYQLAGPDRKGSIYVEGAVFAMMLDLTLRIETQNRVSLLDVVHAMTQRFAVSGYTAENIRQLCEELSGIDLSHFFNTYLYSPTDTLPLLTSLFQKCGLEIDQRTNPKAIEGIYGIRIKESNEEWIVIKVHPNSDAWAELRRGDKVISLNGDSAFTDETELPADNLSIEFERHGKRISAELTSSPTPLFPIIEVRPVSDSALRNHWLQI